MRKWVEPPDTLLFDGLERRLLGVEAVVDRPSGVRRGLLGPVRHNSTPYTPTPDRFWKKRVASAGPRAECDGQASPIVLERKRRGQVQHDPTHGDFDPDADLEQALAQG